MLTALGACQDHRATLSPSLFGPTLSPNVGGRQDDTRRDDIEQATEATAAAGKCHDKGGSREPYGHHQVTLSVT